MNWILNTFNNTKNYENLASMSKTNVMSPLNWFSVIVELALVIGLIRIKTLWIQIFLALLIIVIIIFYGRVFWYFMKNDPNRLQSEEYNLSTQALNLSQDGNNNEFSQLQSDLIQSKTQTHNSITASETIALNSPAETEEK